MSMWMQRRLLTAVALRGPPPRIAGWAPGSRQPLREWLKSDLQQRQQQQQQQQHMLQQQRKKQQQQDAAAVGVYLQHRLATRRFFHAAAGGHIVIDCPPMGDSITEGTLQDWKYAVGSYVEEGALLAVIETDKVSVEINAAASGRISILHARPGDAVFVGKPLYELDATAAPPPADEKSKPDGDAKGDARPPPAAAAAAPAAGGGGVGSTRSQPSGGPAAATPAAAAPAAATPRAAPAAAAKTPASAAAAAPPVVNAAAERVERRVPMSRLRQRVATRLKDAQNTAAMLTTFNECDMGQLLALRNDLNEKYQEQHGVKMGFVSAFMMASALSLKKFPAVNALIDGNEIVFRDYADISVAVATPTGLLVPVVRDCNNKSWAELEKELVALAKKARENQIALEDMAGGTFTISNGGVYGSMLGTPIINPPQSAILGMHGVTNRPVVRDNQIVIRPIMYLALTYDHRLIDGREAVLFLASIRDYIQDPRKMLLGL